VVNGHPSSDQEGRVLQSVSRIPGRYYLAIFVLAFATLSYQILITRFFSVMLYYHFAFAAISLAMLGLTRGAMQVYRKPVRYAAERVEIEFARHASWFALTSAGAMIVFLCVPLVVPEENVPLSLALAIIAFVAPFTEGGVCITLLLTRLPYRGGWLYAADLVGAAAGCLGVIFILLVIDPVSATLWLGAAAAGVGWIVVRTSGDVRSVRLSGAVALALAVAAITHSGLDLTGRSHLGVFWAKGAEQTGTLFERWNTYSRVRVRELAEKVPIGWGLVRTSDARVDQHHLDIDADAGTVITRYDGDIGKLAYLKDDVINAAYIVQPATDVAVVGVGGGRDILSGLLFGAKRIRAIEINPAIFEVLTDKFADFSGHLDRQPGVSLVNAEARSYINHSSERYDLVQISLIDTWAATVAGGLTLTENRLYTVEAWDDFYRALKPDGLLSVSRWYGAERRGELYRLIAIAAGALQRKGVSAAELRHHVVAVNVGNIVTVITRPDAFSSAEWQGVRERLQAQGFKILLGPDFTFDAVTTTLLSDKADQAFFDSLPENIAASTDDNPFFFYTSRFSDFLSIHRWDVMSNNVAIGVTGLLIIVALCACGYYIALPFLGLARRMPMATLTPPVAYFSAIGLGFMLIEISQMQRLMVFLGHPVYGLSVVLFTILLFSGIGSATVGVDSSSRSRVTLFRIAALLTTLVVAGLLTPLLTIWGRALSTDMRILVSVLLLAPPAFCMGMMFPLGLGVWRRHHELLPFFWSTNGITSMFASVLGVALSIQFGIAKTYALGVCFYAVCAIVIIASRWGPVSTEAGIAGKEGATIRLPYK
jgi:spermidine synthase